MDGEVVVSGYPDPGVLRGDAMHRLPIPPANIQSCSSSTKATQPQRYSAKSLSLQAEARHAQAMLKIAQELAGMKADVERRVLEAELAKLSDKTRSKRSTRWSDASESTSPVPDAVGSVVTLPEAHRLHITVPQVQEVVGSVTVVNLPVSNISRQIEPHRPPVMATEAQKPATTVGSVAVVNTQVLNELNSTQRVNRENARSPTATGNLKQPCNHVEPPPTPSDSSLEPKSGEIKRKGAAESVSAGGDFVVESYGDEYVKEVPVKPAQSAVTMSEGRSGGKADGGDFAGAAVPFEQDDRACTQDADEHSDSVVSGMRPGGSLSSVEKLCGGMAHRDLEVELLVTCSTS